MARKAALALVLLVAATSSACGSSDRSRKARARDTEGDAATGGASNPGAGGGPAGSGGRAGTGGAVGAGGALAEGGVEGGGVEGGGVEGGGVEGGGVEGGGVEGGGVEGGRDASGDAPLPPCMALADGTGAVVSTAADTPLERLFDIHGGHLGAGAGPAGALYLLGSDDLPLSSLGGVALAGAGADTRGVLAELDPATLDVVSTVAIDATRVVASSVTVAAGGVWVQIEATGTLSVGGVSPPAPPSTEQDTFVAYLASGVVRFVHRLGTYGSLRRLSLDPSGNAWLLLHRQVTIGGTPYDCGAVVTRLAPTGEYSATRCLSTGVIVPHAILADDAGGAYVSGFPVDIDQDLGGGPFQIDASGGGSVLARIGSGAQLTWRSSFLRAYADELHATPGGFFAIGDMPQVDIRNGLIDIAGTAHLPCRTQTHLTRLSSDGTPLWSRAYDPTSMNSLAVDPSGDILVRMQFADSPLLPGLPALPDRAGFGVLSGADFGRVRWLRSGFSPSSAVPAPGGGWIVAAIAFVPLDGGFQRVVTRVARYD